MSCSWVNSFPSRYISDVASINFVIDGNANIIGRYVEPKR